MKNMMRKMSHRYKSWRAFNKAKMGKYMKSESGHGPAMKRMGKEWKQTMPKNAHKNKKKKK